MSLRLLLFSIFVFSSVTAFGSNFGSGSEFGSGEDRIKRNEDDSGSGVSHDEDCFDNQNSKQVLCMTQWEFLQNVSHIVSSYAQKRVNDETKVAEKKLKNTWVHLIIETSHIDKFMRFPEFIRSFKKYLYKNSIQGYIATTVKSRPGKIFQEFTLSGLGKKKQQKIDIYDGRTTLFFDDEDLYIVKVFIAKDRFLGPQN